MSNKRQSPPPLLFSSQSLINDNLTLQVLNGSTSTESLPFADPNTRNLVAEVSVKVGPHYFIIV